MQFESNRQGLSRMLTLATLVACSSCSTLPITVPAVVGKAENACLPEAIMVAESFRKSSLQARIMIIRTTNFSHATVVYKLSPTDRQLQVWDSQYSNVTIDSDWNDAGNTATQWLKAISVESQLLDSYYL